MKGDKLFPFSSTSFLTSHRNDFLLFLTFESVHEEDRPTLMRVRISFVLPRLFMALCLLTRTFKKVRRKHGREQLGNNNVRFKIIKYQKSRLQKLNFEKFPPKELNAFSFLLFPPFRNVSPLTYSHSNHQPCNRHSSCSS